MRVRCIHGYFIFDPDTASDLSAFASLFGFEIDSSGDHFTFADLAAAPDYAIEGSTYLGAPVTKTFEGKPWEIMRENALVYDFVQGRVVPIASIVRRAAITGTRFGYLAQGMILPGSVTEDGRRVTDYSAHHFDGKQFKYSEIDFDA